VKRAYELVHFTAHSRCIADKKPLQLYDIGVEKATTVFWNQAILRSHIQAIYTRPKAAAPYFFARPVVTFPTADYYVSPFLFWTIEKRMRGKRMRKNVRNREYNHVLKLKM